MTGYSLRMTIVKKRVSFQRFKVDRDRRIAKKFLKSLFKSFIKNVFSYLTGNIYFSAYELVALRISRYITNLQHQVLRGDGSFYALTGW